MNAVFPFDQPAGTVLYLILFVATLVVHFVFMSYVLAGSLRILAGLWMPQKTPSATSDVLTDWMPFMLSGAITAGVAPLLFIQILYRQQFYTANLLQFNRWMAILPVLIVLFYLSYLIKAHGRRRSLAQRLASLVSVASVLFIAWSWSGNHELSLQDPDSWQSHYAGEAADGSHLVILRLLLWVATTLPVLSCLLTWQLRNNPDSDSGQPSSIRGIATTALIGLGLSLSLTCLTGVQLPALARSTVFSQQGMPWVLVAAAGLLLQLGGWAQRLRRRTESTSTRWLVTGGVALHLTGLIMIRELVRLVRLGDRIDFAAHADASTAEGFSLFLVFAVANGAAAAWCIRSVQRSGTDETNDKAP